MFNTVSGCCSPSATATSLLDVHRHRAAHIIFSNCAARRGGTLARHGMCSGARALASGWLVPGREAVRLIAMSNAPHKAFLSAMGLVSRRPTPSCAIATHCKHAPFVV